MSKSSVAKNYVYNLIYQILAIIIPLITTPYLSRILGAENIGIYSYTLSISTYFILFGTFGIAMYGQREIAYVQNDINKRSKIFYEIIIVRFITLSISLLLFYLFFCIDGKYNIYYRILLMEILANIVDISWYFQGLEEFKKTILRNIFVKVISVICIFTIVKTSNDLTIYFIIYVLSNLFGNLSLWVYIPKYIKKQKLKKLNYYKHIKPIVMLFIPQIATQIYTVLDKAMIGSIIDNKAEVGYYEQAQKIIKLSMTVATSFGTVMMPRIAATFSSGNKDKIKKYMTTSFSFILMLAFPLMFGIISISSSFVPLFFGQGYDKVTSLLCIMSPIIVLIGLSNVVGTQYLLPTKQQNKYTISVIIGALVNFALNLVLIKYYASIGAAISTIIAELSVTVTQFILIRNEYNIFDIIKISYKYFLCSFIVFIFSMLFDIYIKSNIMLVFIKIVFSIIFYILLLILVKDRIFNSYINKLLKRK